MSIYNMTDSTYKQFNVPPTTRGKALWNHTINPNMITFGAPTDNMEELRTYVWEFIGNYVETFHAKLAAGVSVVISHPVLKEWNNGDIASVVTDKLTHSGITGFSSVSIVDVPQDILADSDKMRWLSVYIGSANQAPDDFQCFADFSSIPAEVRTAITVGSA